MGLKFERSNDLDKLFDSFAVDPLKKEVPLEELAKQRQEVKKEEAKKQAINMLKLVGIPSPEKRMKQYPHEFSGGMRQRAMIAMSLICEPKLIIADEPTTALD